MLKSTVFIEQNDNIAPAAACLRDGGLVAFPTETVYGLGANALNADAVASIYSAKGRESDNPLIVHISDRSQLDQLVRDIPDYAVKLMDAYWPGPLTLVMHKTQAVPSKVTGGLDTVGIRLPANDTALSLISAAGVPVAAPSANTSGKPSPTRANDVMDDMNGRIDYVIDGGECIVGLESTVLDVTVFPPVVLRPGGITPQMIKDVVGDIAIHSSLMTDNSAKQTAGDSVPKSPGMKYKHYAPKAPMTLYMGTPSDVLLRICKDANEALFGNDAVHTIGIIAHESSIPFLKRMFAGFEHLVLIRPLQRGSTSILFSSLRDFDKDDVDLILCEACVNDLASADINELSNGIVFAETNRMGRAAGFHIIRVDSARRSNNIWRLLFVCTGNTCRSPMAEYIAKDIVSKHPSQDIKFEFSSCGISAFTGDYASENAIIALKEDYGIDMSSHRSSPVTPYLLADSDLILAVSQRHRDAIVSSFPEMNFKCCDLRPEGFTDPYGMDVETYKKCAAELKVAIEGIINDIELACGISKTGVLL